MRGCPGPGKGCEAAKKSSSVTRDVDVDPGFNAAGGQSTAARMPSGDCVLAFCHQVLSSVPSWPSRMLENQRSVSSWEVVTEYGLPTLRYSGIRSTSTMDRNRNDAADGMHSVPSALSKMSGSSQEEAL